MVGMITATDTRPAAINFEAYFKKPPRGVASWVGQAWDTEARQRKFERQSTNCHDENWLTLNCLAGLFGDQGELNFEKRLEALNALLRRTYENRLGTPHAPQFSSLLGVWLEVPLPENKLYRDFLRMFLEDLQGNGFPSHPFADRTQQIEKKLSVGSTGLEGNTRLDVLISGYDNSGQPTHLFIESKYMSDISKDICYNPVRNQIARNVDCALDIVTESGAYVERIGTCYFLLLTPGMFRTPQYGGASGLPDWHRFTPSRSRLYCFKMNDYLDPALLRQDLPHWNPLMDSDHWHTISDSIGWLTFEDVALTVEAANLLESVRLSEYRRFLNERGIIW
jgi:hypothetical protein